MAKTLAAIEPKKTKAAKPKVQIYGPPGVGKTWASLDFPDVYYIDTERGADLEHYTDKLAASGAGYMGPDEGSQKFDIVLEQVELLATTKHKYKTLVIDSLTKLYNETMADAAEDGGDAFGRDKKEANKPMRKLIRWLSKIDMNVILICHAKDNWEDGEKVGLLPDCWDKISYEIHLVLEIKKIGNARHAIIKKSRLNDFLDGKTFPWSYQEFSKKYGADVIERTGDIIKLATPAQVSMAIKLNQAIRLEDGLVEKWFSKAQVDDWSEMAHEDIAKCIKYMEKKREASK